uniref:MAGUK p55 subfamily member 6 n=1 Tax=Strigamia maritima TaxID=126957 RepID=T1JKI1_STRMM
MVVKREGSANRPVKEKAAFQHVQENIDELNGRSGFQDTDLIFLKGLMNSPIMKSLVKVQDSLEGKNGSLEPVGTGNVDLVKEIASTCRKSRNRDATELSRLLQNAHVKALLDAHDTIAGKAYVPPQESQSTLLPPLNGMPTDAIRMVGLRKSSHEPLGVTVKMENSELIIARIMGGGMIDRQGLLHVGDIIKEVNGIEVYTPEQLQEEIKKAEGTVNLKIIPSYSDYPVIPQDLPRRQGSPIPTTPREGRKLTVFTDNLPTLPCYVKALFNYDPKKDTLLPCTDIGLPFKQGEVLQILNTQDPNWWQAKKIGPSPQTGLIPSQELEERRKAFVRPEFDYVTKTSMCGTKVSKKKKKQMYHSRSNTEFDKAELILYEEVARMPPFQRKSLVLIGPPGVGRRTLKNRLIAHNPELFGTVVPHTSRPAKDGEDEGRSYMFSSQEDMEDDINENKYLEFGTYNGYLYGTKLDSIRNVIRSGKMCILDCNPQGLKLLNTPEFMPFVVFLSTPSIETLRQLTDNKTPDSIGSRNFTFDRAIMGRQSRRARTLESLSSIVEEDDMRKKVDESARLQRAFEKYFDVIIMNEDMDRTFEKLLKAVNALSTEPQWVPVSWVY